MFYKFIDNKNIERAPRPLSICGQDIFTNSEKIHNDKGYYRLVQAEHPQNGKLYMPTYELKDNLIYNNWEEIDAPEVSKEDRIVELKQALLDTDYKAIKYAEGWLSAEEYEPTKLQRQEWREEINRLEESKKED